MRIVFLLVFAILRIQSGLAAEKETEQEAPPPRVLPPLLHRLDSAHAQVPQGINVTGADQKRRRAHVGEWLDFGDAFELAPGEAATIIQNESLTWVAGGGFQGRISKNESEDRVFYTLELKKGWVRVWLQPPQEPSANVPMAIEVRSNGEVFTSKEGRFWMSARMGANELYLESGEVVTERAKQVFQGRVFAVLPESGGARKSAAWDPEAVGVHIAQVYPVLVRLAGAVDLQFKHGEMARVYSAVRKRGWKRFHRMAPDVRK